MKKDLLLAGRLSSRLLKGVKQQLYLLLVVIMLFKVEVALMMPLIIKYSFNAMTEGDAPRLLKVTIVGTLVMTVNVCIMYFINVYGDAWATKFAFHAAENTYREMSRLPVWTVKNCYPGDELFQRIASGTGNIMGLYFTLTDLLSNAVATVLLVGIIWRLSPECGLAVLCFIIIQLVCVKIQFALNDKYSKRLQNDKVNSLEKIRSLILASDFHEKNQTGDWMKTLYEESRDVYFKTQKDKMYGNLIFDSIRSIFGGSFKVGFVWSLMSERKIMGMYVENIISVFTTFDSLSTKTEELGRNIAVYPDSLVPINRLGEVLEMDTIQKNVRGEEAYYLENMQVSLSEKKILKDITCCISAKSKIAVIGENGSGKSTLLKVIAGLCQCNGKEVISMEQKVGYIPADDMLFSGHSVMQNIQYGNSTETKEKIIRDLEYLGIQKESGITDRRAREISGGEAKRVNIVRGLLGNADIILADEPTSSLDEKMAKKVMELLLSLEKMVIYITHSPEFARLADEIIFMENGTIGEILKKEECENSQRFQYWAHRENKSEGSNY